MTVTIPRCAQCGKFLADAKPPVPWTNFVTGRLGDCYSNAAESLLQQAVEFVGSTLSLPDVESYRPIDGDHIEFIAWTDNGDEVIWSVTYDSDVDGSRVDAVNVRRAT